MLTDEGYLGLHADHAHITTLSLLPRAVLRGPKQKKLKRKQFSILSGSENLNFELRTAGIIQINSLSRIRIHNPNTFICINGINLN